MGNKLSIITINLNNCDGLKKTIESVLCQTFQDYEYLIIDGASLDGSVELINKYVKQLTYWVSEPDDGIYKAMNKGIIKASGEYCLFLNSGDCLISNSILEKVSDSLSGEGIIYGNGVLSDKNGGSHILTIPEKLTLDFFYFNSLFHPSTFIRRDLFTNYGLYNESNKIVSDWEFFLKTIMVNNVSTKYLPEIISIAEDGGVSRNPGNSYIFNKEVHSIFNQTFPNSVVKLLEDYKKNLADLNWIKKKPLISFLFYLRKVKQKYFGKRLKEVFTQVYDSKYWGGMKSVSGPGSDTGVTDTIQKGILEIIRNKRIKSITDAPCGDFSWMKDVIDSSNNFIESFTGIDIVDELIATNKEKFSTPKVKFQAMDLTVADIPESDIIICRDCFIHLSFMNIFKILKRFKNSNSKYLLLSTYIENCRVNLDISDNIIDFHVLNMQKFPFYFPDPLVIINEGCSEFDGKYNDKSLALWEISQINLWKISVNLMMLKCKFLFLKIKQISKRIINYLKK